MTDDPNTERRDVLSEAFDKLDAEPEVVVEAPPEVVEAAPETEAAPVETAEQKAERARDEAGRFKKAEKGPEEKVEVKPEPIGKVPAPVKAEEPKPVEPAAPAVKAPQAWTQAAREAFAKAPLEVQREVDKREREITRALNETTQVRQFATQVQESLRPYEGIARANGKDAMEWAGDALQALAAIQQGTPEQAAAIAARLVGTLQQRFGDRALDMVNSALANPQAQSAAPAVDPREEVRRILAEERAEQERQSNLQTVQQFLANPPEYWDYVKADVPEIIRLDRARGGNMTPQQAAERAAKYNDEWQGIVSQRKAAEALKARAAEAAKAKAASGSVRHTPAIPPPTDAGDDRISVLSAEYDRLAARG